MVCGYSQDLGRKCIHSNICLARENVWNIHNREDLPPPATVVVVSNGPHCQDKKILNNPLSVMLNLPLYNREGMLEKSSVAQDFPTGKALYSFLQDFVPSSSSFPGWNKGRITCQCSQLKSIMSDTESISDGTAKDEHQMPRRVVTTTRLFPELELSL